MTASTSTASAAVAAVNKAVPHTLVEKLFKAPTYCQVCQGFILGIGKKSCVW